MPGNQLKGLPFTGLRVLLAPIAASWDPRSNQSYFWCLLVAWYQILPTACAFALMHCPLWCRPTGRGPLMAGPVAKPLASVDGRLAREATPGEEIILTWHRVAPATTDVIRSRRASGFLAG